jgi:hypothetical protein
MRAVHQAACASGVIDGALHHDAGRGRGLAEMNRPAGQGEGAFGIDGTTGGGPRRGRRWLDPGHDAACWRRGGRNGIGVRGRSEVVLRW